MSETEFNARISPMNRRTSERKKLIVDVRYEGGDGTGIANTRDIGVGGLYMTTSSTPAVGTQLMMSITIDGRPMRLGGTVVYADPGQGVGIRFKDVSSEDIDFIRERLGSE